MDKEERIAYLQAMTVAAQIELASMLAANTERQADGQAATYPEASIYALIEQYGIHHNAICRLFEQG